MQRSYKNQQLNTPIVIGDLLSDQSITTIQTPFLLTQVDFVYLCGRPPMTASWATNLLFAVVGYAVSLGPKLLATLKGEPSQVSSAEWTTIALGIALALMLYAIGLAMPNERKNLLKRISDHFKNAPASHHVVKEAK